MKKGVLAVSVIFLMGTPSLSLQAADRVQAEHFVPKHVHATTQPSIQCPQGYSRLFGRNPPTCYANCPQGWSVKTDVRTGAVCVRCPPGLVPDYRSGSGQWCYKPAPIVPDKDLPTSGGLWGQPWPK
jgi:hypothetical protein